MDTLLPALLASLVSEQRTESGVYFEWHQHLVFVLAFVAFAHLWWWDVPLRLRQFIRRSVLRDEKACPLPPGGFGLPFLGETPFILFRKAENNKKLGSFFARKAARHGPICCASLPPLSRRAILISDPMDMQWAFAREGRGFNKTSDTATMNVLGANSLLFMKGDLHKRTRSGLLYFFQPKQLATYVKLFDQIVRDHFHEKLPSPSGGTERITVKELAVEIMGKNTYTVLLGQDLEDDSSKTAMLDIVSTLDFMLKGSGMPAINFPGNPYTIAMKHRKKAIAIITDMIKKRRAQSEKTSKGDLLGALLGRQDLLGLTDEAVIDTLILFIGGGSDTSANTLAFALKDLNKNANLLNRVREEHLSLGKAKGGIFSLTFDDMDKIPLTHHVLCEALRRNPPLLMRKIKVMEDVTYKGYLFPKGYTVLTDFGTMQNNPSSFSEPLKFNPDRFKDQDLKTILADPAFKPFGGGSKMCIGYRLAFVQMSIFIHHLMVGFEWKAAPETTDDVVELLVGHPTDGTPMDVSARTH